MKKVAEVVVVVAVAVAVERDDGGDGATGNGGAGVLLLLLEQVNSMRKIHRDFFRLLKSSLRSGELTHHDCHWKLFARFLVKR